MSYTTFARVDSPPLNEQAVMQPNLLTLNVIVKWFI